MRQSLEDVAKRVRAFIAVLRRVRRVPDADAVEHEEQRAHVDTAYNPIGCQAVFISTVSMIQYGFSAVARRTNR